MRYYVLFAVLVGLFLVQGSPSRPFDDQSRTPKQLEEAQKKRAGTPGYGVPRPPGTLLLNMLIKNEREHLDRTLPKWAKIIDYWIIGVDDANTDDSPEIIQKHLGHIPGEIVIVHFDGMGPTWTQLVKVGLENYPQATHGIIADADFMPMSDKLDKMQLDIRCSKHMYHIWTEDHSNVRKMDWIYRNQPGVEIQRRTHQIIQSPEIPYQEVYQTLVDLHIEEREGGYQDRTPGKNERYIQFLKDDLEDYPEDPRTLYYLGYAYYDEFAKTYDARGGNPPDSAWKTLEIGLDYMFRRLKVEGNKEEKWFMILKLGEIFERYYSDWKKASEYYNLCIELDPERADPYFYIGQHHRLAGEYSDAVKWLRQAVRLPYPPRSLFNWRLLYDCLAPVELSRAVLSNPDRSADEVKETLRLLQRANCEKADSTLFNERARAMSVLREQMSQDKDKKKTGNGSSGSSVHRYVKLIRKAVKFYVDHLEAIEDDMGEVITDLTRKRSSRRLSVHELMFEEIEKMHEFSKEHKKKKTQLSCSQYRKATGPFLKVFRTYEDDIYSEMENAPFLKEWKELVLALRTECR